jgi:antitoxin component of MazEF toxin-antitoxin module
MKHFKSGYLRVGNSTGLRLPASVMDAAGREPGDYVYARLLDTGDIRVRPIKNVQRAITRGSAPCTRWATAPPEETNW